jgi:hypothetical protein
MRLAALLIALAAAGCAAAPDSRSYAATAASMPAVAPGLARLYVYRRSDYYDTREAVGVYLNDKPIGSLPSGTVLYRDIPPGNYRISTRDSAQTAAYSKNFSVQPGHAAYERIDTVVSLRCGDPIGCRADTFAIDAVDAARGASEIGPLGRAGQ